MQTRLIVRWPITGRAGGSGAEAAPITARRAAVMLGAGWLMISGSARPIWSFCAAALPPFKAGSLPSPYSPDPGR